LHGTEQDAADPSSASASLPTIDAKQYAAAPALTSSANVQSLQQI